MTTTMFTGGNVATLVAQRQAALSLTDAHLASAIGYDNAKAITLIKAGTMRVPLNKVAALASALQVSGFDLLRAHLTETAPDLWTAIQELAAPIGALAPSEVKLLRHLRQLSAGKETAPIVFDGKIIVALVTAG